MTRAGMILMCCCCLLSLLLQAQERPGAAEGRYVHALAASTDTAEVSALIREGDKQVWRKPDSALYCFRRAEQISRALKYPDGVVRGLMNQGHAFAALGHHQQSLAMYRKAWPYCRFTTDRSMGARVCSDVATTYLLQSDYPMAARYFFASLAEMKQQGFGEHPGILIVYANLAYLQSKMQRYDLSLQYLGQAEAIARRKAYHGQLGFILNNKGEVYSALNQYDKAFRCYQEGLRSLSRDHGQSEGRNTEIRQSIQVSLGELMLKQQQPQQAVEYLLASIRLGAHTNPYYSFIFPHYMLGRAYYQLRQYGKAEQSLVRALGKARELGFREDMPEALQTLTAVYEALGQYHKALQSQQAYMKLRDSLMNGEKTLAVHQLELKYRTSQKDKELAEKELLISRQNNQIIRKNTWLLVCSLSALLLMVLSLLLLLLYRSNQHRQRLQEEKIRTIAREMELVEQEKNILKREEEIRVFQALISGEERERVRIARELHDGIGGMLAAIQMHFSAIENRAGAPQAGHRMKQVMKMLADAATEVRKTAHNLMPDVVLNHTLEEALQLFCANVNAAGRLRIDLQLYEHIGPLDKSAELSVYRIVQELVQNIIRHAGAAEAVIQITRRQSRLHIMTEDNGRGFDPGLQQPGLGLQNLHSRVKALRGELSIDSAPGKGTTTSIELDLSTLNPCDP